MKYIPEEAPDSHDIRINGVISILGSNINYHYHWQQKDEEQRPSAVPLHFRAQTVASPAEATAKRSLLAVSSARRAGATSASSPSFFFVRFVERSNSNLRAAAAAAGLSKPAARALVRPPPRIRMREETRRWKVIKSLLLRSALDARSVRGARFRDF